MNDNVVESLVDAGMTGLFVGSLIGLAAVFFENHHDRKAEEAQRQRDWESEERRKMREHFAQYARKS